MAGNKNPYGPNVMTVQEATNQIAQRRIIRVTPTLNEDVAYGSGDVLFNATEIPKAVIRPGGCSKLITFSMLNSNYDILDIDFVFMQVSTELGTINAAVGSGGLWTDSLAKAAKVIGHFNLDGSDADCGLVANRLYTASAHVGSSVATQLPILLQAEEDSTSVYVAGILRDQTPTFTEVDDIDLMFHIEY